MLLQLLIISLSFLRCQRTTTFFATTTVLNTVIECSTITILSTETSPPTEQQSEDVTVADEDSYRQKMITYEQFCRAVSFYNLTMAGGLPSRPSFKIYQGYVDHVTHQMDLMEQAMLLANLIWESGGFQHREEIACRGAIAPTRRCPYGRYYGRGWIQLSWDYNYKTASEEIYGDNRLVMVPGVVATEDGAWRTAVWYWRTAVRPMLDRHNALSTRSFGWSVRAINGAQECLLDAKTRMNWRRQPKLNFQAARDRLTIFNAILVDWGLADDQFDYGTLDGCHSVERLTKCPLSYLNHRH